MKKEVNYMVKQSSTNSYSQAIRACRLLVEAYRKAEESHSVNWEDVDIAVEAAQSALDMAGEARKRKR